MTKKRNIKKARKKHIKKSKTKKAIRVSVIGFQIVNTQMKPAENNEDQKQQLHKFDEETNHKSMRYGLGAGVFFTLLNAALIISGLILPWFQSTTTEIALFQIRTVSSNGTVNFTETSSLFDTVGCDTFGTRVKGSIGCSICAIVFCAMLLVVLCKEIFDPSSTGHAHGPGFSFNHVFYVFFQSLIGLFLVIAWPISLSLITSSGVCDGKFNKYDIGTGLAATIAAWCVPLVSMAVVSLLGCFGHDLPLCQ